MEHLFLMFLDHKRRTTAGRTSDQLVQRSPTDCGASCDLETSRIDAPYIYMTLVA